jgi:hypothetical protein
MARLFFNFLILIFSSALLSLQCHRCYDPPCTDRNLGTLKLADSTQYWIPYGVSTSLMFKNSNGFVAEFHNGGPVLDSSSILMTNQIGSNCGDPSVPCYEYWNIQTSSFLFRSDSVPLVFKIKRTKNIGYGLLSAPAFAHDLLEVSINNSSFFVNLNNDTIYLSHNYSEESATEYLGAMNIGGKSYADVYRSYFIYSHGPVPEIPAAVFYNKQYGLLRFDFSNNEIWELQ